MPCIFCNIVNRQEPATIRYETEELIVFDNRLRWAPHMLLITTKKHMSQDEMWATMMHELGPLATRIGNELCPNGFRLLSNFGRDAMQSQMHGHLHLLGGTHLGPYA